MTDVLHGQEPPEFPKFLSRDDNICIAATQPPPMPGYAPWSKLLLSSFGTRRLYAVAAIGAPVFASVAFLTEPKSVHPREHFVTLVKIQSRAAPRDTTFAEMSAAVGMVAQLEARLGYAGNLTGHVQDFKMGDDHDPLEALLTNAESTSHLPEFSTQPAPVGESAWKEAASNPDQLVVTPSDDVDVSTPNAGLQTRPIASLSVLHLDLSGPEVAAKRAKIKAEVVENDADDSSTPRPRAHRVHAHKVQQVADDDESPKRHVRRHKVAKVKDVETTQQPDDQDADKTAKAEKEAPKGTIAKFFTWLKGKKPPATDDNETARTGLGMVPQD